MRRPARILLSLLAATAAVACSAIVGLDAPPSEDAGAVPHTDATMPGGDAGAPDAGADTSTSGNDSSTTVEAGPPPTCAPLGNGPYLPLTPGVDDAGASTWQAYDVAPVGSIGTQGYTGGTFDGRYIYFAGLGVKIARYDTLGAFDDPASWLGFGPTPASGFAGAVYDGRYVYFVPNSHGGGPASLAARYDTLGAFNVPSSWTLLDLATLADGGAPTAGFFGAVFDGHSVFFAPHNDGNPDGHALKYDVGSALDAAPPVADAGGIVEGGTFGNLASWASFDTTQVNPVARGFSGAVYGNGALYFVPQTNGAYDAEVHGGADGIVARHELASAFTSASTWSTYDVTLVEGLAAGFIGGAFDGQYVYLVPKSNGVAVRLDTTATNFATAASWQAYDTTRAVTTDGGGSVGFAGAGYDGRFIYYVPTVGSPPRLLRYDTQSTFTADCAWSSVDLGPIAPPDGGPPPGYTGAVFDGQYLYLLPGVGPYPLFLRFEARTSPAMPNLPNFHGSFL
jgi:hypothetical protein